MKEKAGVGIILFFCIVFITGIFLSSRKNQSYSKPNIPQNNESILPISNNWATPSTQLIIASEIKTNKNTEISSGILVTDKGDNLLVLINKHIRLPANYEPADLVDIGVLNKPGLRLRKEAALALNNMLEAARSEGANLAIVSAYRSYWQQAATFQGWFNKEGIAAETFSARPGHSQHQLGSAVDFTNLSANQNFSEGFGASVEGAWLASNAYKFGFVLSYPKGAEPITGYIYEPWHYRYIGIENALVLIQSGLNLEEFLKKFGVA